MARSPQSYQKRRRELRKKERKAGKACGPARQEFRRLDDADDGSASEDELLEQFRLLNEQFASGDVTEDDFEYRKAELFAQLGLGEPPAPRDETPDSTDD